MIERIYIPTIRRYHRQITFNGLPEEMRRRVIMVVEPTERPHYQYDCDYLVIPEEIVGSWTQLAQTRLLIHKHAGNIRYVVADDDVVIKRRNAKYWTGVSNMEKSRRDATKEEILEMFRTFDSWLNEAGIGIVGPSNAEAPPPSKEYADTKGIFTFVCIDGKMLSEVIDDMDITSIRVAEDVLFMYECLSRGINTRLSTEWMMDNRSLNSKELQNTRVIWEGMFKNQPDDPFQTDAHYKALEYIRNKYPHGMKIYEKGGKRKNTKYWKKVYQPVKRISL
jgi:hypothetical protein